jgi:hypothetical protein
VPPHSVADVEGIKSIFEVEHLRREAFFLDTQCEYITWSIMKLRQIHRLFKDRMPVPIGEFLSREVYDGRLQSRHRINSTGCIRLVDCEQGQELDKNFSWVVGLLPNDLSQLLSQS